MKKVATETRLETSYASFFEPESSADNQNLDFINKHEILNNESIKPNPLLKLLKQIFFFLPGAFLLYLISFIGTIILIYSFSAQGSIEIFGIRSVPLQMIIFLIIASLGAFMTWFGLGDIKNKKHLGIPTSIIITSGIIALVSIFFGDVLGFAGLFDVMNYYFIYLFPLILVVPILVKGWVDRKMEDS